MNASSAATEIAVVGLGCVLPDAGSPAAFQANLRSGHSAIRDVGQERPGWRRYVRDGSGGADASYTLLAAPIRGYTFDWRRFRIPPLDAAAINPMQLIGLDAGDQALRSVKVLPRETTGVFVGATGLGWQPDSGLHIRLPDFVDALAAAATELGLSSELQQALIVESSRRLRERLKPVSDDTVVNAAASVIGGRIAMHYDLTGPHYAVDGGYASALAALDVAVRSLQDGTVDLALVGGVSELLTPLELVAFAKLGGLARHEVAPFDQAAAGTLLGEGVVMFALKRLDDAERDQETIHAVIRGVAGATDPPQRALLAPNADGQEQALRAAYAHAGVSPSTVAFIACHATGTPLGDATEVRALRRVFADHPGRVALCSAKPFVGHLRGASGAVGLLHGILALEERCVPAQINFRAPHPDLELDQTPFFIPTQHHGLEETDDLPIRAGVSAFGFGGISFHAVLEAYRQPASRAGSRRPGARRSTPEPLAITGMGAVMPGAADVNQFWSRLLEGYDAAREVPAERWPIERYFHRDPTRLDTTYSKLGCFLERYPDPAPAWRIPPAARPNIDPEQLVLLQAAEEAVADARYDPERWDSTRVSVVVAFLPYQGTRFLSDLRVNYVEYAAELEAALLAAGVDEPTRGRMLEATERRFKRGLPPVTEDSLVGWLGSIGAARVARRWGFRGPHFAVDSACASSHAALHAAGQMLHHGTADVAIVGGVWCDMMPEFYVAACRFNALSGTGITPFDARADGFVPGEGAGVVVLRRVRDAERDGDPIHGMLLGVHGSSDGRGRSVLAPKPEGELAAMRRALMVSGVRPETVDYVECHGTGTALGDRVEVHAITEAYGRNRARPLLIGSVKSNYGHLNAAAGMPALIKTVLAVREGVIPPSINCTQLNPEIDFAAGPVQVVTETARWSAEDGRPRRAGVSGFGVGGTNMHLIVQQYGVAGRAETRAQAGERGAILPHIAAASGADLGECAGQLTRLAEAVRGTDPPGFAQSLAESRRRAAKTLEGVRVTIVAGDPEVLDRRVELLTGAVGRGVDLSIMRHQGVFVGTPGATPTVALAFPGQGPQYPGMLREALTRFPSMERTISAIDEAYERSAGRPLSPTFLGEASPDAEDVHCAVFAVGCSIAALLQSYGLRYQAVVGQSAGELAALVMAGVLSLEDGLLALRERTRSVLDLPLADPGRMIAVACSAERAAALCDMSGGVAFVAADNSPGASIISADTPTARQVMTLCATEGIEATELDVSHAYHSPVIAAGRERYRQVLEGLHFGAPDCDIVSTITGRSIQTLPPSRYPVLLAQQFVQPVRMREAIETLYGQGIRLFIECGPKWPLTSYIDDTLAGRDHLSQPTMHPKPGEIEQLHRALACLFAFGAVDLAASDAPSITSN